MSLTDLIEEQAAGWLIRREGPDWTATDDAEFDGWLDASFNHKAAYWRLEHAWRAADRISSIGPDAAHSLERDAFDEGNVVSIEAESAARRRFAGGWRPLALAASLMLALLAGWNVLQGWGTATATLEQLGPIAIAPEPPQRAELVQTGTGGAASGNGMFAVAPGMPVTDPRGKVIGYIQELQQMGSGVVQAVTVEVGNRAATLPAASFAGSGDVLVSGMTKGQLRKTAEQQDAAN